MRDCWQWEATRRPTFQEIHYEMENMFQVSYNLPPPPLPAERRKTERRNIERRKTERRRTERRKTKRGKTERGKTERELLNVERQKC